MAKSKKLDHSHNVEEEAFPSNSNASKVAPIRPEYREEDGANIVEEPQPITKTIKGRAIRRKKSLSRSIKETFINENSKNVGHYIVFEVLIPAAKNMIQEMFTQGIEMFLFGESGGGRNRSKRMDKTIVSYGSMYRRDSERPESRHSRRDKFDLSEIFFKRGDEANEVLEQLCDQLEKYDEVTVSDYFDFAGINGANWVHAKWGWTNLKRAYCTHTRNGYAIVLPDPEELG
jgi:hypothetical protein